jgi:hypothetical protein
VQRALAITVSLPLALAACGGDENPSADGRPGAVDAAFVDASSVDATAHADAPSSNGTPAPAGGWPVSSRCALVVSGGCDLVEAETWDRTGVASIASDHDANVARFLDPDGELILELAPPAWIAPSGLTALPDGGWVLAAAALGPGDLRVGTGVIALPDTYNRVVAKVVGDDLVWFQLVEGATAESAFVAARTDNSVVVGGEQMIDTTIGDVTLAGPVWLYDFFLATLTPAGAWAWAIELPQPASPLGDFRLVTLALGPQSEAIAIGVVRGTVSVAGDTVTGPTEARAIAAETGAWLGLETP